MSDEKVGAALIVVARLGLGLACAFASLLGVCCLFSPLSHWRAYVVPPFGPGELSFVWATILATLIAAGIFTCWRLWAEVLSDQ